MIRGKSVRMQVFVRPQPCSQPVEPESKSIEYFLYRSPCLCHRERLRSSRMVFSWLSGLCSRDKTHTTPECRPIVHNRSGSSHAVTSGV